MYLYVPCTCTSYDVPLYYVHVHVLALCSRYTRLVLLNVLVHHTHVLIHVLHYDMYYIGTSTQWLYTYSYKLLLQQGLLMVCNSRYIRVPVVRCTYVHRSPLYMYIVYSSSRRSRTTPVSSGAYIVRCTMYDVRLPLVRCTMYYVRCTGTSYLVRYIVYSTMYYTIYVKCSCHTGVQNCTGRSVGVLSRPFFLFHFFSLFHEFEEDDRCIHSPYHPPAPPLAAHCGPANLPGPPARCAPSLLHSPASHDPARTC